MKGLRRRLVTCLFFVLVFFVWEAMFRARIWSRVLVPSPVDVFVYLYHAAREGTLFVATWVTFKRLLIGYGSGLLTGALLGFLNARFRIADATLGVITLGFQTLPSVCWVPLSLLWFGQTEAAMQFVVIMGTVWSMAIAVADGVRNIPPIYGRAARTMGATGFNLWFCVMLPATLPFLVSGMKQSWAFAWRSLMAAEIYVTILTGFGLGHLLHYGRELHAMDQVLGIILVIIVLGLVITRLVFTPMEQFLARRWGTVK